VKVQPQWVVTPGKQTKQTSVSLCTKISEKASVLLKGTQVSPFCPSGNSSFDDKMKMSMEEWWYDTARGKSKYTEKNATQCHSAHQKHNRNCHLPK
jgi:hypothetical protein